VALCITYHAMYRCGGVEVYFHAFFTSALNGSQLLALGFGRFPRGERARGTNTLNEFVLFCKVFGRSSLTLTTTFNECRETQKLSVDHK
jgi:hypothetical protein